MLVNGDLVRIPQGTVIMDVDTDPTPLQVATHPKVGIIIDNKPQPESLVKILLDDEIYLVERRLVQIVRK